MGAGFRPERTIAGVALLLVGVVAVVAGVVGIAVAPILGFVPADELHRAEATLFATLVAVWGFAIVSVALAAMILAGWHAQLSLAAATALVLAAVLALGPAQAPGVWLLLAVAILNAGAFVAGTVRQRRG